MWHDLAAEATKQVRRPAHWMLLAVAAALTLSFGYLVPYASYGGNDSQQGGSTLATMLPENFQAVAVGGTPVFTGCLALIFGALVLGSEYHWETWKTVLSQHSSRVSVYAAKLAVLAIGAVVMVLALGASAVGAAVTIAQLEGQSIVWPSAAEIARALAAGVLICTTWACLGATLAVILRSVATPIGLGLVWMLAVQNLLTTIAAPALDWVATLQKGLPGANAGSLAASMGASEAAPGIDEIVTSGQATLVLAAYLTGFALAGAVLLARRDIR